MNLAQEINLFDYELKKYITDQEILNQLKNIHCKEGKLLAEVRKIMKQKTSAKLWYEWNDYKKPNMNYYISKNNPNYAEEEFEQVKYNFSCCPILNSARHYFRLDIHVSEGYITVIDGWLEEV